jgi:hypothetical protein
MIPGLAAFGGVDIIAARVFDPETTAYAEFFVNPLKAAASLGSEGDRSLFATHEGVIE